MTEPRQDLTVVGTVEEIKENAPNLDLTWGLRPATVVNTDGVIINVVFDGDANAIPILSLVGTLGVGDRVYVMQIPPSGNYAIGAGGGSPLPQAGGFNGFANIPQSKNDTAFADVLAVGAVPAATTLYKQRESSRVMYNVFPDCFAANVGNTVEFALLINGTDYAVSSLFFNAANDHRQVTGGGVLSAAIPAGVYTVTLRWRRVTGTAMTMDANSRLSFNVSEVAPIPT